MEKRSDYEWYKEKLNKQGQMFPQNYMGLTALYKDKNQTSEKGD